MRILQLIDSLNPGGAERMALNYFKALKERGYKSVLVLSREKGLLAEEVSEDPSFYFLNKRNTFDIRALWKFRRILRENKIDIVQAHGTSWFFAVLSKLSGSHFKLIWHDHYGNSEFLEKRNLQPLKIFSKHFDGIISVNRKLEKWAKEKLNFKKPLIFLPNFVRGAETETKSLQGVEQYKLIVVANLRIQKDHLNLLKAFDKLKEEFSVSLHLFGQHYKGAYSEMLKVEFEKGEHIYYYGEVAAVIPYLKSADIGILSSSSEGLPLAVIEYGLAGLPVVCTQVGECAEVTGKYAQLIPAENAKKLEEAVSFYLKNPEKRKKDAFQLNKRVKELYSEAEVLSQYREYIKKV